MTMVVGFATRLKEDLVLAPALYLSLATIIVEIDLEEGGGEIRILRDKEPRELRESRMYTSVGFLFLTLDKVGLRTAVSKESPNDRPGSLKILV
jgi:hypothetical protein